MDVGHLQDEEQGGTLYTELCAGLCCVWFWVETTGTNNEYSVLAGSLRVPVRGGVVRCVPGGEAECTVPGAVPGKFVVHGWGWEFAGYRTCVALGAGRGVARPPEARGRCASAGTVQSVTPSGP